MPKSIFQQSFVNALLNWPWGVSGGAKEDPVSRNPRSVGTDRSSDTSVPSKVIDIIMGIGPGCTGSRARGLGRSEWAAHLGWMSRSFGMIKRHFRRIKDLNALS